MNFTTDMAEMVRMFLAAKVAVMLLLAVIAYVSSIVVLDWLESLDRWLDASQKPGNGHPDWKKAPDPPAPPPSRGDSS